MTTKVVAICEKCGAEAKGEIPENGAYVRAPGNWGSVNGSDVCAECLEEYNNLTQEWIDGDLE